MPLTFDDAPAGSEWEKKVWGWAWHLYASDQTAVSFLKTKKGFRCSRHKHRDRANLFAVIEGKIAVQEWCPFGQGLPPLETIIGPGETYFVSSGRLHRFRVLESGMVVEVYWVDAKVSIDDIERLDEGGVDDSS